MCGIASRLPQPMVSLLVGRREDPPWAPMGTLALSNVRVAGGFARSQAGDALPSAYLISANRTFPVNWTRQKFLETGGLPDPFRDPSGARFALRQGLVQRQRGW